MFMEWSYKYSEISDEFYYLAEKYQKYSKWLISRRSCENAMKILENLGENQLEFIEKFHIIKSWRIMSIGRVKDRYLRARV